MDYAYDLISFKLCPFVQRSVITLLEKGASYSIQYIELKHKPAWFLEISPLGKVPVLRVNDDVVLFESAVINEFIEETAGGPKMHPEDPVARARNRAWIEVASDLLRRMQRMANALTEATTRKEATSVRSLLERLDHELCGPLWGGESFSLVDAAVAPALQRLTWCAELQPSLGLFDDLPRLGAWRDTLLARPAVQGSTVAEIREMFVEHVAQQGGWIALEHAAGDGNG